MKIGILGGTFNPIHIGHLILAEEVREKLTLDKVIFVPAFIPPHKKNSDIICAKHRYEMLKLATRTNKNFSVSDIEIKRDGLSYTIDTIQEFKRVFPKDELYFIIGSDLLNYLQDWKDLGEILKIVKFIVATRPGYALEKIPSYMRTIDIRAIDVSGYEIRRCIKAGLSFRYLVCDSVYKYINKKRLYR